MKSAAERVLKEYHPIITNQIRLSSETIKLPHFDQPVVMQLVEDMKNFIKNKRALIRLNTPITLVGDIHGSIFDLLRIFQIFGPPPLRNYLFLGDYVDRGAFSLEVMTLLMALNLKYPNNIHLLRGNHEFRHINQVYGFYNEVMEVFDEESCYDRFNELFSYMPLAAIINSQVLCVHGGLSPHLTSIDVLEKITLPIVSYDNQPLISDLVWSDPRDDSSGYTVNQRGSGTFFGPNALQTFLAETGLKFLVRAHQCVAEGFSFFANSLGVTLFSCSNYCHIIDNKCGLMQMKTGGDIELYSVEANATKGLKPKMVCTYRGRAHGLQKKNSCFSQESNEPVTPIVRSESASIIKRKSIRSGHCNSVVLESPSYLIGTSSIETSLSTSNANSSYSSTTTPSYSSTTTPSYSSTTTPSYSSTTTPYYTSKAPSPIPSISTLPLSSMTSSYADARNVSPRYQSNYSSPRLSSSSSVKRITSYDSISSSPSGEYRSKISTALAPAPTPVSPPLSSPPPKIPGPSKPAPPLPRPRTVTRSVQRHYSFGPGSKIPPGLSTSPTDKVEKRSPF